MTTQQIKAEIESVTQIIAQQTEERERKFLASLPADLKRCIQWERDTTIIELNEEIY
jgi:hypothetical protein